MRKTFSHILFIAAIFLTTLGCVFTELIGYQNEIPDISAAVLTENDVPQSFKQLSEDELASQGLTGEALTGDFELQQARGQNVSAFLNSDEEQYGLILSMIVYPLSQVETVSMDMELFINDLSNENYAAEMVESFGQDASLISEASSIGDKSIGIRFTPRDMVMYDGVGEIVIFRKDNALGMVMTNTILPTQIDAVELAQVLCQRLADVLE